MSSYRLRRLDESVVMREITGQTFLVPIRGTLAELQDLFVVNEVGQWVWGQLDGSRGADDLVADACLEFDVTPETARADIEAFLQDVLDAGLAEDTGAAEDAGGEEV
jgi:hypothetical protein